MSSSRFFEEAASHHGPSTKTAAASPGEDEERAARYFGDNLDEADLVEEVELSKAQARHVLKKVLDDFAGPKEVKS